MSYKVLRGAADEPAPARHLLGILVVTAIATSLDAMAVGVTLAFVSVNIVTASAAIGLATSLMATVGTLTGRWLGPIFGRGRSSWAASAWSGSAPKILLERTLGI